MPFNDSGTVQSYISVYEFNSSGSYGVCAGCDFNIVTSEFHVSASPSNVTYSPSTQYEDVTYTISVPSNATSGIYGVFLLQFCSLFPMVVDPGNNSALQLEQCGFLLLVSSLWLVP